MRSYLRLCFCVCAPSFGDMEWVHVICVCCPQALGVLYVRTQLVKLLIPRGLWYRENTHTYTRLLTRTHSATPITKNTVTISSFHHWYYHGKGVCKEAHAVVGLRNILICDLILWRFANMDRLSYHNSVDFFNVAQLQTHAVYFSPSIQVSEGAK